MSEFVISSCKGFYCLQSLPFFDHNRQMALSEQAVLKHEIPNPTQRGVEKWKMYAIKQIKICAECRDMLRRPRMDLSGTPGFRPIGLSSGS